MGILIKFTGEYVEGTHVVDNLSFPQTRDSRHSNVGRGSRWLFGKKARQIIPRGPISHQVSTAVGRGSGGLLTIEARHPDSPRHLLPKLLCIIRFEIRRPVVIVKSILHKPPKGRVWVSTGLGDQAMMDRIEVDVVKMSFKVYRVPDDAIPEPVLPDSTPLHSVDRAVPLPERHFHAQHCI